jgi:heme A synthase
VVLWGAYVRATGSGAGCGNHWPLCNGVAVPRSPTLATIIEFTHRATSGIDLLLIVGLVVWAFRAYPSEHRVRLGATLSGLFILSEAAIGAGLVLLEHVAGNASLGRAWSLSLHLINTFTLLAVLALTAWWSSGGAAISLRGGRLILTTIATLVVLGISGAIAALGDTLFPSSSLSAGWSQDFSPAAHVFLRLRILHPALAIVAAGLVLLTATRTMTRQSNVKPVQNLGTLLIVLVISQVILGLINLTMLAPVPLQLMHLAMADAVWISMVLFAAAALAV